MRTLVFMATDNSHKLIMGSHHIFSSVFDRFFFILAGNDDKHKSLDDFEIRPDPSADYRVSCS